MTLPIPPLHDIDIKHLRLFKAVVECGGLSAAEEATGLGTSAISKQLSDLETRVGCQLCVRGRSGFQLTAEGQVAYAATLRLLDAIDEFREVLGTAKNEIRGELSIWLIDHSAFTPANPVSMAIGEFCDRYPQVTLTLNVASPDLVERAVAEKKAALGITICKSNLPSLNYQVVTSESASMYCGRGHAAFGADEHRARQLVEESACYVRRGYLVNETVPLSLSERARTLSHHVEGTLQLLLCGQFVGIVPDHIAEPWVERGKLYRLPVPEWMSERPVFCVTRESLGVVRAADLMQALIVETFQRASGHQVDIDPTA
jgi:LysR family transcriptional regulator, transcriptional activator for bauABCD operon